MARELRGFRVWALLLAVIVLCLAGAGTWWTFSRPPVTTSEPPKPLIPDAVLKIPGVLRNEVAALKESNDRLAAKIPEAEALLKGDVCDPKRQAEVETLLQKIEFGAQLETPPAQIDQAAKVSPASVTPAAAAPVLRNNTLVQQLRAQILTNRHIVAGSVGRDLVVMGTSTSVPLLGRVKVLSDEPMGNAGDNYSDDFALISVSGSLSAPRLHMAGRVQPLNPVIAAGFPTNVITADKQFQDLPAGRAVGMPQVVLSRGDIRVVENQRGPGPVVAHIAEISEGNSGGQQVNACGQLVGINTFGIRIPGESRSSSLAMGNGAIDRFLRRQNVALETGDSCAADRM